MGDNNAKKVEVALCPFAGGKVDVSRRISVGLGQPLNVFGMIVGEAVRRIHRGIVRHIADKITRARMGNGFYKKRVPKALIDTKDRWMMIIIVLDKIGAGTNWDKKQEVGLGI